MRIYTDGRPKGRELKPYIDIYPGRDGVTILFSENGYYITRREEISNEYILDCILNLFQGEAET